MRCLVGVVLTFLVAAPSRAELHEWVEFPICTGPEAQSYPSICGDIAVWTDYRYASDDIYARDLATGVESPVVTGYGHQQKPAIYQQTVVWYDTRNDGIWGCDLATGRQVPISEYSDDPAIWGNTIVYDHDAWGWGSHDIYGYDLAAQREFPICTADEWQMYPDICGNIVVWADARNTRTLGSGFDIYGYDLATGTEFPICTEPGSQGVLGGPAIYGDNVVWRDAAGGIAGCNLSTGAHFRAPGTSGCSFPDIYGNLVVWEQARPGSQGSGIYGWYLGSDETFPTTSRWGDQACPAVWGSTVVWWDQCSGDIYGARPAVPEPSSLSLLAASVVAGGALRLRRRRR